MKKFIISAISLAILLMAFACAEPSSTSDAGTTKETILPSSYLGTYKLTSLTDYYDEKIYDADPSGISLKITFDENDKIWYEGKFIEEDGAEHKIQKTEFGWFTLYTPETKVASVDTNENRADWTFSGNTSKLRIKIEDGRYFKFGSDFETYYCSEIDLQKQ